MKVKKLVKNIFIASCGLVLFSAPLTIGYAKVSNASEVNNELINQNSTIITGKILPNDTYIIKDIKGNIVLEGISDSNGIFHKKVRGLDENDTLVLNYRGQSIKTDNQGFMAIFKYKPYVLFASGPFDPPEYDDPSYWWGQAKNFQALFFQSTLGLYNSRQAYKQALISGKGMSWYQAINFENISLALLSIGQGFYDSYKSQQATKETLEKLSKDFNDSYSKIMKKLDWFVDNMDVEFSFNTQVDIDDNNEAQAKSTRKFVKLLDMLNTILEGDKYDSFKSGYDGYKMLNPSELSNKTPDEKNEEIFRLMSKLAKYEKYEGIDDGIDAALDSFYEQQIKNQGGYIELQSSQLAVMIEAINNLNSLEDITKQKFAYKISQIDSKFDVNNYDGEAKYSPAGKVCDGSISTLYMQAIERDDKFLDYMASVYYLIIADNIVTQYPSSNINPSAVDTNLPIGDQRIRMSAYNMISAYYDQKQKISNIADSTLNNCQYFGDFNAPRIPGISYQTQNTWGLPLILYLVIDLQDDGGSLDIPSADVIFNNKDLRKQYFSELQNKFLDAVFEGIWDIPSVKYLDGNVKQIGVKLNLKSDALVNAKELVSSVSKQNAYISYVFQDVSSLFVHYPNFTDIAFDNAITEKMQQQLSDPNNYYIRIAETILKKPANIDVENHMLVYDASGISYKDYIASIVGDQTENLCDQQGKCYYPITAELHYIDPDTKLDQVIDKKELAITRYSNNV
ncbi:hypothetical protein IB680_07305 [Francisella philomiragia]|uniref:hypothetical protein n=1 Tax=Francisella philomiragia TaxID=28110 RepID=UPI001904FCEE|nr:hypothetical protein [Francisella philomiragia]MBK2095482.1 hypothetical protein [Francisella philomiragia]